jgi:hypothetical protein
MVLRFVVVMEEYFDRGPWWLHFEWFFCSAHGGIF